MNQGLYLDLSAEAYAEIPALRSSFLRAMLRTTPHKALTEKAPDSPALEFGRLLHACVLEPERFERELAVMPEFKGKGANGMRAEWILRNAGKIQVKPKVLEHLLAMRDAVLKDERARKIFEAEGHNEVSAVWDDPLGFKAKARFDRIFSRSGVRLSDLKSTRSAQEDFFRFDVKQYGYDVEACLYLRALDVIYEPLHRPFYFVAVEKVAPYRVEIYELTNAERALGQQKMERAMQVYAECLRTGEWPTTPVYRPNEIEEQEGAA